MKLDQLKKLFTELLEGTASARRFYKLDDTFALCVDLSPSRRRDIPETLTAHVTAYQKHVTPMRVQEVDGAIKDVEDVDWECIDYETLPAKLLGRLAEIKSMVEKWNANEADDLPPSTMENFLATTDWISRRSRRRVR